MVRTGTAHNTTENAGFEQLLHSMLSDAQTVYRAYTGLRDAPLLSNKRAHTYRGACCRLKPPETRSALNSTCPRAARQPSLGPAPAWFPHHKRVQVKVWSASHKAHEIHLLGQGPQHGHCNQLGLQSSAAARTQTWTSMHLYPQSSRRLAGEGNQLLLHAKHKQPRLTAHVVHKPQPEVSWQDGAQAQWTGRGRT